MTALQPTQGNTPPDVESSNVLPFTAKEMHRGQLRIAERFVKRYAGELLYVHGHGWHYWAGTHWCEDDTEKVRRRVTALLKETLHEAVEMSPSVARTDLFKDVRICESNGGITGILELAKSMHPMTVSVKKVNTDPFLFNTANGTLNLNTGDLQPHNPADMITKCAGTDLDPDAHSDLWDDFLDTVLPDEDIRAYLQRVFGVAMLGLVRDHNLPILTGTGGNGKGVCTDAVLSAFGDYGITVDPKLIMQTKHERHATFMMDLLGARLVVTDETNEGEVLAAATVKRLTGGNKIRANRMRENPIEFPPSHTLVYVTNFKPKVSGEDKALWRRLAVVPFDVKVEDPDITLPEKIKTCLPAVLAWVYQGWLDYQGQGLNPPAAVVERTETYRAESDPLGQFLAQETIQSPLAYIPAGALYRAWQAWAAKNGHPPVTQTDFGRRMTTHGLHKGQGRKRTCYVEIGLRSEEEGALTFDPS
jgi:putative DNA primase/helicase